MPAIAAALCNRAAALRELHTMGHGLAGEDLARHAEELERLAPRIEQLERQCERGDTAALDLAEHARAGHVLS